MSLGYKYRTTRNGDFLSCDSCQSEAPLEDFGSVDGAQSVSGVQVRQKRRWLCEVCSSTYVGNRTRVLATTVEAYAHDQQTIIIAQVTNLLLDKLTSRNEARADAVELPPEETDGD